MCPQYFQHLKAWIPNPYVTNTLVLETFDGLWGQSYLKVKHSCMNCMCLRLIMDQTIKTSFNLSETVTSEYSVGLSLNTNDLYADA